MKLETYIQNEFRSSDSLAAAGKYVAAFGHLERAHVIGQASTYQHTRVHLRMFKIGLKIGSLREIWGQLIRIIGALSKTPLGIYPKGNTGGANVWFFRPMSVPEDLQEILNQAKLD